MSKNQKNRPVQISDAEKDGEVKNEPPKGVDLLSGLKSGLAHSKK